MRSIAKTKIDVLVRFHQPQEDVDTIRGMINQSMVKVVAIFTTIIVSMFKLIHQKLTKIIMIKKKFMMMFILSLATWTKTF